MSGQEPQSQELIGIHGEVRARWRVAGSRAHYQERLLVLRLNESQMFSLTQLETGEPINYECIVRVRGNRAQGTRIRLHRPH